MSKSGEEVLRKSVLHLLATQALQHGQFTLSSGQTGEWYVDCRPVLMTVAGQVKIGRWVLQAARRMTAEALLARTVIVGPESGAIPILCAALGADEDGTLQAAWVRKEAREHGTRRWLEGAELAPGQAVWIVDDVLTTGASIERTADRVHQERGVVLGAIVLVDRRGADIGQVPYPVCAACTLGDLITYRSGRK